MINVFEPVRQLLKVDDVRIDNNIFRLHYKATTILLIAFSLIISSKQFVGDPIDCITSVPERQVVNTFCWTHSTFTVASAPLFTNPEGHKIIHHKYYQWVCFVLFFQAILFYVPRYLWKAWDGGRMKMLVADLNYPILSDSTSKHRKLLVDYFSTNLHMHNCYAYRFFFCEFLNFVNVVGQIFFIDFFLGGGFSNYGLDFITFTNEDPEKRTDAMSKIFPKMAKCTFKKSGPSSEIETRDALCILPLNVVNEKVYVFLWYWFILLAILSGLGLAYRAVILACPKLRLILLRARADRFSSSGMGFIAKFKHIGDWFVLHQLGHNMNRIIYKKFLDDLTAAFNVERIEYEL